MNTIGWIIMILLTLFLGYSMLTFVFSFFVPFISGAQFPLSCTWAAGFKNFYLNLNPILRTFPLFAPFNAELHTVCEPYTVGDYRYIGTNTIAYSDDLAERLLDLASSCWKLLSLNDLLADEGNTMRCYAGEIGAEILYMNGLGTQPPETDTCDSYGLCQKCVTECGGEGYCFAASPGACDGARAVEWRDTGTACHTAGRCYCVVEEAKCSDDNKLTCQGNICTNVYGCTSDEIPGSIIGNMPDTSCSHCSQLCSRYGLSSVGYCLSSMLPDSCKDTDTLYDWAYLPEGVGDNCWDGSDCYCVRETQSSICSQTGCDEKQYYGEDYGLLPDIEIRAEDLSFFPKIVFIKPGPNGAEYVDMKENAQPVSARYFEIVYSDWKTFRPEGVLDILNMLNPIIETKMRAETLYSYLTPAVREGIYAATGQGCENRIVDGYTLQQSWETVLMLASATADGILEIGPDNPYATSGCGPLMKSMVCCEDKIFICLTDSLWMGFIPESECGDGACEGEDPCSCPQDCGPPSGTCELT